MIQTFDAVLPHGVTLACRAAGDAGPQVMLLHGFPEAAFVWDDTMAALADRMRCVAPNLRGYAGSSSPTDLEAYKARHLVADLVALVHQRGGPLDLLVAHDWGGALAWNLAAQQPQLVRRLLIINAPHPACFLRELRDSPAQQQASAYMNALRRPQAAERLAADGFARLWQMLDSPLRPRTAAQRARYEAAWRQGLQGPLNYYRASPLHPPDAEGDGGAGLARLRFADADVRVPMPTEVLWGEQDKALLPGLLDGLSRWVPKLTVQRLPQASHWVLHEQPERVRLAIEEALARPV